MHPFISLALLFYSSEYWSKAKNAPSLGSPVVNEESMRHNLANWDSCPTPAKSEGIEYLKVGPTEIRYSIAWTIFVYL